MSGAKSRAVICSARSRSLAGASGGGALRAFSGGAAGRGFSLSPLCRLWGEARSPRASDAELARFVLDMGTTDLEGFTHSDPDGDLASPTDLTAVGVTSVGPSYDLSSGRNPI